MADLLFSQLAGTTLKQGTDILYTSGRTELGQAPGWYVADAAATPALALAHPRFAATTANSRVVRALPHDGRIPVELGGARGDGSTDDSAAIRASIAYGGAIAARGIAFHSSRYRLTPVPLAEINYGQGPQPGIVIPENAPPIDGRGAHISLTSGGRAAVFGALWLGGAAHADVTADIAAGAVTIPLAGTTAFAEGDEVLWQLGEFPYDPPETPNWGFARIVAKTDTSITIDRPIPEPFTLADVTGINKRVSKMACLRDFSIRNLTLDAPQGAESGLVIQGGQRLTFEGIGGRNLGAGLIVAKFCDGLTLTDCWHDNVILSQPSYGGAFQFAECRNVQLIRPRASGRLSLVSCEAGAEASIVGGHFANTLTDANGQPLGLQVQVLQAVGRSRISAHDLTVTGHGGYVLAGTSNGQAGYDGHVRLTGRTRLIHPTDPWQIPLQQMSGTLDMTIGGLRETYNLDALRHWRRRFTLRDGQYTTILGPMGILMKARVYVSPGVTIGTGQQLAALTIGRQGNNGSNTAVGAYGGLAAGIDSWLDIPGGKVAGAQWSNRTLPLQVNCTTTSGAGLDAANAFVEIEAWFAEPDGVDRPVSEADWRGMGAEREPYEARFPGYDLPAITPGETATIDLTVPDMAAGDFIMGASLSTGLAGLSIRSAEALAGMARIAFENQTPATIDRGPAELRIAFVKSILGT